MSSLQDFLENHPDLIVGKQFPIQDASEITLNGILVSANKNSDIIFEHLGQRFYIASSDVISVEETKDATHTFEEGIAVTITVKADTQLIPYEAVAALNFNSGVPFAISRPSQISETDYPGLTAKDLAWLAKNGIPCFESKYLFVRTVSTPATGPKLDVS